MAFLDLYFFGIADRVFLFVCFLGVGNYYCDLFGFLSQLLFFFENKISMYGPLCVAEVNAHVGPMFPGILFYSSSRTSSLKAAWSSSKTCSKATVKEYCLRNIYIKTRAIEARSSL